MQTLYHANLSIWFLIFIGPCYVSAEGVNTDNEIVFFESYLLQNSSQMMKWEGVHKTLMFQIGAIFQIFNNCFKSKNYNHVSFT